MNSHTNQLQNLDGIEEDLAESLSAASQALKELSKDKPVVKSVETFTNTFMSRLDRAGSELSHQIAYLTRVTTGQSAEGSSYGSKKDFKMAKSRLEHAQARLRSLESAANQWFQLATSIEIIWVKESIQQLLIEFQNGALVDVS